MTRDDLLCSAFAIDSKYVDDGATGGAARWREANWVTDSRRLASHVDLWMDVLLLLETLGHRATVLHVYSRINLPGNNLADGLANDGRSSVSLTPQG